MPDKISVNGTELEYQLRGTGTGNPSSSSTGAWPRHGPSRSWTSKP